MTLSKGKFDANGGDFDILREAMLATGLDRTLSGRRQLTVFAPTDQAFLDLTGAATEGAAFAAVASLGLDAVADVLAYHVAPGRRAAGPRPTSCRPSGFGHCRVTS